MPVVGAVHSIKTGGFIFGSRVEDLGGLTSDAISAFGGRDTEGGLGGAIPALRGGEEENPDISGDEGRDLAEVTGDIIIPVPSIHGVPAPAMTLIDGISWAVRAINGDQGAFDDMAYATSQVQDRTWDASIPFFKASRQFAQGFQLEPLTVSEGLEIPLLTGPELDDGYRPPYRLRLSPDPKAPWAVMGTDDKVKYYTTEEALRRTALLGGVSQQLHATIAQQNVENTLWNRRLRSRDRAGQDIRVHIDAWARDKDQSHIDRIRELVEQQGFRQQDIEARYENAKLPANIRRAMSRGDNGYRVQVIARAWAKRGRTGMTKFQLRTALMRIKSIEGMTAAEYTLFEQLGALVRPEQTKE